LQAQLTELESLYNIGIKAIAGLKAALAVKGWCTPWPAAPNTALDEKGMEKVRAILAKWSQERE
jgi:hypothetical protein